MAKYNITLKTIVTIRRPDGTIDKTERPGAISPKLRKMHTEATRNAGRGDIINWQAITVQRKSQSCPSYTKDQGCAMHGETCAPAYR